MKTRQYISEGLSPDVARRRALKEFGERSAVEAACIGFAAVRDARYRRQAWRAAWLDDVRDAVRTMRRRPAAPLAVFSLLTVGIAMTGAALALSASVLRAQLPYPSPESLVALQGYLTQEGRRQTWPAGYLDMVDLDELVRPRMYLAAHSAARPLNLLTASGAGVVHAEMVSASYFEVLRVGAAQGRVFNQTEDRRSASAPVVVVSDDFWRTQLGGTAVIGTPLVLNERSYTIVGVMPRGFRGVTDEADLWLPVNAGATIYNANYINGRSLRWVSIIGRLSDGVTLAQGEEALRVASAELAKRHPQENGGLVFVPRDLQEHIFGTMPLSLYAAAAAAALVMLLVYINVGGLSLSRAVSMGHDFAVKSALGATTARLVRQSLVQWLLVAIVAAALTLAIVPAVARLILASGAFEMPSFVNLAVTPGVVLAVPLMALAGALVAAAAPVVLSQRVTLASIGAGGRATASPLIRRVGYAVVCAQIAVASALLFTGVLMIRTVIQLRTGVLGWHPANVGAMRIDLLGDRYGSDRAKWQLADDFLSRLEAVVPGPIALSGPGGVPTGQLFLTRATIDGYQPPAGSEPRPWLSWHAVTPAYFDVLGIDLRQGRAFTSADREGAQRVAIVTESFARQFWPGQDPVGRRIDSGVRENGNVVWMIVVGVTEDVDFEAHRRERDLADHVHVFVPLAQRAPAQPARAHLLVRSDKLAQVAEAARDALQTVAPTLPLHPPIVLADELERETVRDRLIAAILAIFAGVALAVSIIGIYATVAFEVSRRAPEYGLRLALGAARAHIVRLAAVRTAVVAGAGLLLGLGAGAALATTGRALLFGLEPLDAGTALLVSLILPVAAGLGLWRPLRKAATTDPATVLRQS
jgi:putative ABC transport system permease protein